MRKFIILVLLAIVVAAITLIKLYHCILQEPIGSVLIGVMTSSFVVLIIETIIYINFNNKTNYITGAFERTAIYNKIKKPISDRIYEELDYKNVKKYFQIKRVGDLAFEIKDIYYEEGIKKISIFLESGNPNYGMGTYQYISKKEEYQVYMPDFGKMEFVKDKVDSNLIYVYHKNVAPSGLAEGYEIWKKK